MVNAAFKRKNTLEKFIKNNKGKIAKVDKNRKYKLFCGRQYTSYLDKNQIIQSTLLLKNRFINQKKRNITYFRRTSKKIKLKVQTPY